MKELAAVRALDLSGAGTCLGRGLPLTNVMVTRMADLVARGRM